MTASNGIRTEGPVWAASDRSAHLKTTSVPSARVEDGTRGTARDQDADAKSYGSLSKILQRVRAGGGADRGGLVARRPSSKQAMQKWLPAVHASGFFAHVAAILLQ